MEETKVAQDVDSIVLEEEIDPNYVPSEDEVIEYAKWLGMDLDKDQDLFWIAREGLMAPLPPSWKPCKTKDTEDVYYFNFTTGESTWDHPCDGYYKRQYEEQKKKKEISNKDKSDAKKTQAKKDVSLLTGKEEKKQRKSFDLGSLKIPNVTSGGSLERKPLPGIAGLQQPAPLQHATSLPATPLTGSTRDKAADREVERLTGSSSETVLGAVNTNKSKASSKLLAAMGDSDPKPQLSVSKSLDFKSDSKPELSSFTKKLPKDRLPLGGLHSSTPTSISSTNREEKGTVDTPTEGTFHGSSVQSSSSYDHSPPPRKMASSPVQDPTPSPPGGGPGRLHSADREQLKIAQQNLASYRQSAEEREEKLRDRIASLITENESLKNRINSNNTVTDADVSELRALKAENKKITESFQLKLLNQESEASTRYQKLENEKKLILIENERLTRMTQSPTPSNFASGGDTDAVTQLKRTIQFLTDEMATLRVNTLNAENKHVSEMNESNRKVIELLEKVEATQLKAITQENEFLQRINKLENEKRELRNQMDSARTSPSMAATPTPSGDSELVVQLRKKIELLESSVNSNAVSESKENTISESKHLIEVQKLRDEIEMLQFQLTRQESEWKTQIRRLEDEKKSLNSQVNQLKDTVSDLQSISNTNTGSSVASVRSESPELVKQLKLKIERLEGELNILHANEITQELQKLELTESHHKQVTELQQQNNELRQKNLNLSKNITDLSMEKEDAKASRLVEVTNLRDTIAKLEAEAKASEAKSESDALTIAELRKKIETMESLTSANSYNSTLATNMAKLERKSSMDLAEAAERKYQMSQQQVESLQTKLTNLQSEYASHVSKLEANNSTLQALSSSTESETAQKLKQALQQHEKDIRIIADLQKQLEAEQGRVLSQYEELVRVKKEWETEKSTLMAENLKVQQTATANAASQSRTAEDLKTQNLALQEQLRLKSIEMEDERMLLNSKIDRLESTVNQINVQLESEKNLVQQKDKKIRSYQEELLQIQKRLSDREEQARGASPVRVHDSSNKQDDTSLDHTAVVEELSKAKVELTVSRAKLDALKIELSKAREANVSKDASIAAYVQAIEDLQESALASVESGSSVGGPAPSAADSVTLINLRKTLNSKESELKLLSAEHDVLTNKLNNVEDESASYRRSWQDSENSILKLKGQHLAALKEKDAELIQVESKCSTLQQSLYEVTKEADSKRGAVTQLTAELKEKEARIASLESKITKLTAQLNAAVTAAAVAASSASDAPTNSASAVSAVVDSAVVAPQIPGLVKMESINSLIELSITVSKQQENLVRLEQQLHSMKSASVAAPGSPNKRSNQLLSSASETDTSPDSEQQNHHSRKTSRSASAPLRRSHSAGAAGSTPARVKFSDNVESSASHRDHLKKSKSEGAADYFMSPSSESETSLSLLPTHTPEQESRVYDGAVEPKERLRNIQRIVQKITDLEAKQIFSDASVQDIQQYLEIEANLVKLENHLMQECNAAVVQTKKDLNTHQKHIAKLKSAWKQGVSDSSTSAINEQTKRLNEEIESYRNLQLLCKNREKKVVQLSEEVNKLSARIGSDFSKAKKTVRSVHHLQSELMNGLEQLMSLLSKLLDNKKQSSTASAFAELATPSPRMMSQLLQRQNSVRQPAFDDSFIEYAGRFADHQPYRRNEAADFIAANNKLRDPFSFQRSLSSSNAVAEAMLRHKPQDRTRVSAQTHIDAFEKRQNATFKECDDHVNWLNSLQKELGSAVHSASVKSSIQQSSQFVARSFSDVENRQSSLSNISGAATGGGGAAQIFHI